jgi:hypothetical protein
MQAARAITKLLAARIDAVTARRVFSENGLSANS